ncbi:MAG: signal peptidase II [Polyangiaceae bacterium]|nr:signal peptidase II [Polyangiaceae bacterium]
MARRARGLLLLFLTAGLVGCDHATKLAAESTLRGDGPVSVVPGLLDLRYAQNHGTAFSLIPGSELPALRIVLVAVALVAVAALAVVWWRRRAQAPSLELWGYAFVGAGAVGNLLDRVLRGYVVDFIHLRFWPIFNVADVAIAVGAGLLLVAALRGRAPPQPSGAR